MTSQDMNDAFCIWSKIPPLCQNQFPQNVSSRHKRGKHLLT